MNLRGLATLLCLAAGCTSSGGDPAQSASTAAQPNAQPKAAPQPKKDTADYSGVITGTITLADGAKLPSREDYGRMGDLVVIDPVKPCSPLSERDRQPVELLDAKLRTLSNLHVAVTGMKGDRERAPQVLDVTIEDCRVRPNMIGIRRGDSVRITNNSEVGLLPIFSFEQFMPALAPKQARVVEVPRAGIFTLGCGFAAYCGHAHMISVHHTLFDVSDNKGSFRIEGVPVGQKLVVHAWHPLFKESKQAFTLTAAAKEQKFALVMTPAPAKKKKKPEGPPTTKDGVVIQ